MIILNVFLAVVWCAMWGAFTPANFAFGFFLGYGLIWLLSRRGVVSAQEYVQKLPKVFGLAAFFLWELVLANLRLAWDAVTPGLDATPAILSVPLDAKTDAEIFLFSVLVTLTPGTMSMDVSSDRSALFVHVLYAKREDLDKIRQGLKDGFERRVLEVMRSEGAGP